MMECFGGEGWGMGMGMGWIGMLLFWGLVIAAIVVLVRRVGTQSGAQSGVPPQPAATAPARTPLTILQERYARGEIERDEYETKRRDLNGGGV